MCGRYVSASPPQEIADYFGATSVAESLLEPAAPTSSEEPGAIRFMANFNVAPTAMVPVVANSKGERHLSLMRWGLIPRWAKSANIGAKMINARSETAATKNAFRAAAKKRRCIIPADAFYEWTAVAHPDGKKPAKQPWCIQRNDGEMFAFAGLFEYWTDPEGDPNDQVMSCAVLTRQANAAMEPIHDRMPVMVDPRHWPQWLDRDNEDIDTLLASIPAIPSELLAIHAVSIAVNNSRSRGAELMNEVTPMTEHPAITQARQAAAPAPDQGSLL